MPTKDDVCRLRCSSKNDHLPPPALPDMSTTSPHILEHSRTIQTNLFIVVDTFIPDYSTVLIQVISTAHL